MKKRTKRIVLFSIFAIITTALIWFFQFYDFGYKMTVPLRPNYTKIDENVYVHKKYGVKNEEILLMLGAARQRVDDQDDQAHQRDVAEYLDIDKPHRSQRGDGADAKCRQNDAKHKST